MRKLLLPLLLRHPKIDIHLKTKHPNLCALGVAASRESLAYPPVESVMLKEMLVDPRIVLEDNDIVLLLELAAAHGYSDYFENIKTLVLHPKIKSRLRNLGTSWWSLFLDMLYDPLLQRDHLLLQDPLLLLHSLLL